MDQSVKKMDRSPTVVDFVLHINQRPKTRLELNRLFCILSLGTQYDMEVPSNDTEVDTMPHRWPADTNFRLWELDVLDRDCAFTAHDAHLRSSVSPFLYP